MTFPFWDNNTVFLWVYLIAMETSNVFIWQYHPPECLKVYLKMKDYYLIHWLYKLVFRCHCPAKEALLRSIIGKAAQKNNNTNASSKCI